MSSLLNGHAPKRQHKAQRSLPLPTYALNEKSSSSSSSSSTSPFASFSSFRSPPSSFFTTFYIPLPFLPGRRRLRVPLPIPPRAYYASVSQFGRRRGCAILALAVVGVLWLMVSLMRRVRMRIAEQQWSQSSGSFFPASTLVFERDDLRKVWEWEIASGHYPSNRKIPEEVGLRKEPINPALPPRRKTIPSRFRPPPKLSATDTRGIGSKRVYLDIQSRPPNVSYPPRPVPGSVADLDVVMDHCDFNRNKYVRDCLEVLRMGGGLDNGNRLRRGNVDEWKYIYMEQGEPQNSTLDAPPEAQPNRWAAEYARDRSSAEGPNAGLTKKRGAEWEPALHLPDPIDYHRSEILDGPCDPDHPRVYHMFWTGPFTDKPYLALLSFLFTQNLGLHFDPDAPQPSMSMANVCRPQFWMWINPGPAAAVPNPNARRQMFEQLKSNAWASPFLHPRFKDVIMFKMWNTTEQLDGVPELKEDWREYEDALFNSGGHIISVKKESATDSAATTAKTSTSAAEVLAETTTEAPGGEHTGAEHNGDRTGTAASGTASVKSEKDDMINRMGSKSSSSYDRMSVILSDLARFVLCHRFGGIYLDADTILLRDWEELWGWKGAFAYRWSRLENYNTAVLHLNKGSALGSFLFRTALRNKLDFHPMTVTDYAKDAYMGGLLLRLPDALFDSAWLNTEYYQRDRPPQPYFASFEEFFEAPSTSNAAPAAMGFEGFFRGAYSYHFHNFWWKPFDPARNWPDLGERFAKGERQAKDELYEAALAGDEPVTLYNLEEGWKETVADDKRDLDWSVVLKRTFEAFVRGERPNMYGEWLQW